MAERQRSRDGTRETEGFTGGAATPGQQGRAQGTLERQVGARDEAKQAAQGAGATRVRKSDEAGAGSLGGHHGTGGAE